MRAGIEVTYDYCETDGIQKRTDLEIIFDHRNFFRIDLPRKSRKILQSSRYLISSNRANGYVSVMLYESNLLRSHPDELQRVVGYIVKYASKSTETEKSTRNKMKILIVQEKESASNTPDVRRVAIKCINQITKGKLTSKQEAMCLTGGLSLFTCSETI